MNKTGKTHVAFVLDKSGSMWNQRKQAIDHVNEQVQTLKGAPKEIRDNTLVTFIVFNYECSVVMRGVPLDEVEDIKLEDYEPDGGTALFDAQALAINTLKSLNMEPGEDDAFLVCSVTDGGENASQKYPRAGGAWGSGQNADLVAMIDQCEKTNQWTFTTLGEMSVVETQQTVNSISSSETFASNSLSSEGRGLESVKYAATEGLHNYVRARTLGGTSVSNFYDPNQAQVFSNTGKEITEEKDESTPDTP